MNPFETQARLGRELFEVNTGTIRKFVELGGEELRKVWELNQEFAQKLPEVRDISTFVELQREYGQTVWEGVKTAVQSRGEIMKDAAEQSGGLIRNIFNPETSVEEEKEVKEVKEEAA
ncbi:MAG: phasin family protein [Gammaproteobacteria bacterium]|nr:phasin family protein [Gammaproteobacteria bacterium]